MGTYEREAHDRYVREHHSHPGEDRRGYLDRLDDERDRLKDEKMRNEKQTKKGVEE